MKTKKTKQINELDNALTDQIKAMWELQKQVDEIKEKLYEVGEAFKAIKAQIDENMQDMR